MHNTIRHFYAELRQYSTLCSQIYHNHTSSSKPRSIPLRFLPGSLLYPCVSHCSVYDAHVEGRDRRCAFKDKLWRKLLTGRNPYTLPSRRHFASDTLYFYPRLLDMGRSTRCTPSYMQSFSHMFVVCMLGAGKRTCRIWWRRGLSIRQASRQP
jgi:hypothetical protein